MFLRLSLFYFFYFAIIGVYVIFFPKALQMVGYSSTQIGVLLSAAPLMRFIVPFFFLKHIKLDKKSYVFSLFVLSISVTLFYPSLNSFVALLFVNLLFGASISISLPYVEARALDILDRSTYGKSRLFGSIGFMLIALWLGKVLETPVDTINYLLGTTLFTALSGLAIVYGINESENKEEKEKSKTNFSIIGFWPLWLSFFLMQVSFGGFYNFFTIYETSHGVSLETTSWLWSFGVICEIAMLYFQGPLLSRNLFAIIEITIALTVLRWILFWLFPDNLTTAFIAQSLHAFGFALYHTASITLLHTLYHQKILAQQFFLGISYGLGGFIGSIVAGWAYGEDLFFVEALIATTAFLVLKLQKRDNI